jgi:hypothetical protein
MLHTARLTRGLLRQGVQIVATAEADKAAFENDF